MFNSRNYPQYEFSKEIIKEVIPKGRKTSLIDAPCGNGETTYNISADASLDVTGYDISKKSIDYAKQKFVRNNLKYEVADIFDVFRKHSDIDYFCMINSLFLLEKQDEIIKNIHKVLSEKGILFFIIPNINGINYLNFKRNNQDVNSMELSNTDFKKYIERFNFKMIACKPICYANIYGRKELRLFSVFAPFYLRLLNIYMTAFKKGTPSYYMFSFQKN